MKKNYSDLLKDPRWQKKRLEILQRDDFRCKLCNDNKTQLQVHHKRYIAGCDPWDIANKYLITLCKECHEVVENSKNKFKATNETFDFNKIRVYSIRNKGDQMKITYYRYSNNGILVVVKSDDDNFIMYGINPEWAKGIINVLKQINNGKKIY